MSWLTWQVGETSSDFAGVVDQVVGTEGRGTKDDRRTFCSMTKAGRASLVGCGCLRACRVRSNQVQLNERLGVLVASVTEKSTPLAVIG